MYQAAKPLHAVSNTPEVAAINLAIAHYIKRHVAAMAWPLNLPGVVP
jgi:hypothetical protein